MEIIISAFLLAILFVILIFGSGILIRLEHLINMVDAFAEMVSDFHHKDKRP
jgi:hypothetical protein